MDSRIAGRTHRVYGISRMGWAELSEIRISGRNWRCTPGRRISAGRVVGRISRRPVRAGLPPGLFWSLPESGAESGCEHPERGNRSRRPYTRWWWECRPARGTRICLEPPERPNHRHRHSILPYRTVSFPQLYRVASNRERPSRRRRVVVEESRELWDLWARIRRALIERTHYWFTKIVTSDWPWGPTWGYPLSDTEIPFSVS